MKYNENFSIITDVPETKIEKSTEGLAKISLIAFTDFNETKLIFHPNCGKNINLDEKILQEFDSTPTDTMLILIQNNGIAFNICISSIKDSELSRFKDCIKEIYNKVQISIFKNFEGHNVSIITVAF